MADEVKVQRGIGCDMATHQGFVSKRNKQSQLLMSNDGDELVHAVKDSAGKTVKSRTFTVGQYARIVRGLQPGEEIDEDKVALDELSYGKIESFWTCLDGRDAQAIGAQLDLRPQKVRLPLRTLLPMEQPAIDA